MYTGMLKKVRVNLILRNKAHKLKLDGCPGGQSPPGIKMIVECATGVLKILPSQGVGNVI